MQDMTRPYGLARSRRGYALLATRPGPCFSPASTAGPGPDAAGKMGAGRRSRSLDMARMVAPGTGIGRVIPAGTRLINRDVPQEVVRVLLDHSSGEMTAHYARLHDSTVRRHWERARKVDIKGEQVSIDPAGPLSEATWAKQRLGRATQALPNGYCGLPIQKTCPHANSCFSELTV